MSANAETDSLSNPQRYNSSPNQLANLKLWEPGKSANPGGFRKNNVRGDLAYQRLASMPSDELRDYEPQNALEEGIKNCILRACDTKDWQAAHAAIKELVDRLDGKATQRKEVEINVNIEQKREIQIKAYCLVFENKSEEEALDEIRRIYAAQNAIEREQVIAEVLEADAQAVDAVIEQAQALVLSGKR